jgi:hypothetical protein
MLANYANLGDFVETDYTGSVTGRFDKAEVELLLKAMSANDVTGTQTWDRTDLSAAPLKVESLESTMKVLTAQPQHYPIFSKMAKKPVSNNVAEYLQLVSYGNFDGGFLAEGELPEVSDSIYRRKAQHVKYMGITGGVTLQAQLVQLGGGIANMLAEETKNKSKALAQMIEYHLPFADDRIVPDNFRGLFAQLETESEYPTYESYMASENVIDCRGRILTTEDCAAATLTIRERFGIADTIVSHPAVFTNFSKRYHDKMIARPLPADLTAGMWGPIVNTIQTQNGVLNTLQSNFFRFGQTKNSLTPAASSKAPATPSAVAFSSLATPESRFSEVGDYIYAVSAKNKYGESALFYVNNGNIVTANPGSAVILTPTRGTTSQYPETAWCVYRSKPITGSTDLRDVKMYKIFEAGLEAVTTGYDGAPTGSIADKDRFIAGTDQAWIVDWNSDQVFSWLQLAPMMKMNLAVTAPIHRFMVMIFGTPVIYAPLKTVRLINIGDKW